MPPSLRRLIALGGLAVLAAAGVWSQTSLTQKIPDPGSGKLVDFTITISQDGSKFTVELLGKSEIFPLEDLGRGTESAYLGWLYAVLARQGRLPQGFASPSPYSPGPATPAPSPPPAAAALPKAGGGSSATAPQPEKKPAYAFVWQNSKGYWFADGPIQKLSIGEKTMEEALSYVVGRGRSPEKYIPYIWEGVWGGGTLIRLAGPPLESYERDIASLYNYIP